MTAALPTLIPLLAFIAAICLALTVAGLIAKAAQRREEAELAELAAHWAGRRLTETVADDRFQARARLWEASGIHGPLKAPIPVPVTALKRKPRLLPKSYERGQVLIEAVILMPVALLVLLFGLDVSLMMNAAQSLSYVAQQTAECQTVPGACTDPAAYARQLGGGLGLVPDRLTVTTGCTPTACSAALAYAYQPFGPFPIQTISRAASAVKP